MPKEKKYTKEENKERAKKLFVMLTEDELDQFSSAVESDFGCQWDGTWDKPGIFEELYKLLGK